MVRETCPKCGHEFEGGVKMVPPMPDPPSKNAIILTRPPPDTPENSPEQG